MAVAIDRAEIAEAVVAEHEIDVQAHPGGVRIVHQRLQAGLRAVERRIAGAAQVKAIVRIVADR